MKVLFPDDIETITISKNDYDRLYGDLTYQNIELQQENARLKEIENKLIFIKNRVKQGMSQEEVNKCAIHFVNSYLKNHQEN